MARTLQVPGAGRIKVGTYPWEPDRAPKRCGYRYRDIKCAKLTSPHYCEPRAKVVEDFFSEGLRLIDGDQAGLPFRLEGWHLATARKLYGIVVWHEELKRFVRRYKICWIVVGRKNAKTTLAAGLAIAHLRQGSYGSQIVVAAQSKEQAESYIGDIIDRMLQISPAGEAAGVYARRGARAGYYSDINAASLKLVTSDDMKNRGANPTCAVMDEVLAVDRAAELAAVWQDAWGTRPGPVMIATTTPHYNEMSYERETTRHARNIKDNPDLDPSFLPIIYEPEPSADLWSEQTWLEANPGCATGIKSLTEIREKAVRAKGDPRLEATFLREQVCSPSAEAMYYIPMTTWAQCAGTGNYLDIRERLKSYERVWAGVDLSAVHDLTSLAIVGYDPIKRSYAIAQWSWIPERARETLNDQLLGKPNEWITADALRMLPEAETSIEQVGSEIIDIIADYPLEDIGLDPWRAQRFQIQLEERGIIGAKMKQGRVLTPAIYELRDLAMDGRIEHGADPVLNYAIESAQVKILPGDTCLIEKHERDKDSRRVDPLIATLIAVMRIQTYRDADSGISGISMPTGARVMSGRYRQPASTAQRNRFGII